MTAAKTIMNTYEQWHRLNRLRSQAEWQAYCVREECKAIRRIIALPYESPYRADRTYDKTKTVTYRIHKELRRVRRNLGITAY